jgi:hypothetical protein
MRRQAAISQFDWIRDKSIDAAERPESRHSLSRSWPKEQNLLSNDRNYRVQQGVSGRHLSSLPRFRQLPRRTIFLEA